VTTEDAVRQIQLDELRARIVALVETEEAVRSTMQDEIDCIVEENGDFIAGRCECCAKVVFFGDRGHQYEDGPLSCSDCSPTWEDAKENWESSEADDEQRAEFQARLEKHLAAGGKLEDRLDYVL
jgi:hypothetical protein